MTCRTCGVQKPLEEMHGYWHNRQNKRRYGPDCKVCRSAKRRADSEAKAKASERKRIRYAEDEDYRRRTLDNQRLTRMNITREQFDTIFASQGGGCAICGTKTPDGNGWHLDHDHSCCPPITSGGRRACGKCVRGITCNRCNLAMGRLRDDPEVVLKMYHYLTDRSVPA